MAADPDLLEAFRDRTRELADLKAALNVLAWDQETMMPSGGAPFRARQMSTLAALRHRRLVDSRWPELLEALGATELDEWDRAGVREMEREHGRAVRLPESLVRELAETASLAYQAWVQARHDSDYSVFAPWLGRILELKRHEARCLRESGPLYEALLDEYEPGMQVARLDSLFQEVGPRLKALLQKIQDSSRPPDPGLLSGHFPSQRQEEFGRQVITAMGFDWEKGRLDRSPHPFCTGFAPGDVRITTRYSPEDFGSSLFGMIHEAGHALYEQGLDAERYGSPACDAISLGMHESQSRLWENLVARSERFWSHWFPRLQDAFPGQFEGVALEEFLLAINRVEATLIRVEADEVTYGLHVILRYELEQAMIEGDLGVEDLEEAWAVKMNDCLGVTPPDSARGVLQDTHWSQGLIGYFPTYLLGNLYASQIYAKATRCLPDWESSLGQGRLEPMREWLRCEVHRKGRTLGADVLLQQVTGARIGAGAFLDYLESKYNQLYGL